MMFSSKSTSRLTHPTKYKILLSSQVWESPQDYPCNPITLKKTGLTVLESQELTIDRYDRLVEKLKNLKASNLMRLEEAYMEYASDMECCCLDDIDSCYDNMYLEVPYVMPVLQGSSEADYLHHLHLYGDRINHEMWLGVGSLVGRTISEIEAILIALKTERPDLLLHGFGIGKSKLKSSIIWDCLHSADSAVASFRLRTEQNNPTLAREYANSLSANKPKQASIFSLF